MINEVTWGLLKRSLPNAICLHEQDNSIGWKHSDWRTGRAVVTRHRELVGQFIITLANYEYIFAYKFDQADGITVESRATRTLNVVNIDPRALESTDCTPMWCIRCTPAMMLG